MVSSACWFAGREMAKERKKEGGWGGWWWCWDREGGWKGSLVLNSLGKQWGGDGVEGAAQQSTVIIEMEDACMAETWKCCTLESSLERFICKHGVIKCG